MVFQGSEDRMVKVVGVVRTAWLRGDGCLAPDGYGYGWLLLAG